jgi:hypothetical protein
MNNFYKIYKLRDWIDINKLNWIGLSNNSNDIYLLETRVFFRRKNSSLCSHFK